MRGVLLDPKTGEPAGDELVELAAVREETNRRAAERAMERAPSEVLTNLHKARLEREVDPYSSYDVRMPMKFAKTASLNTWSETLYSSTVSETALTAASEAVVYPASTVPGWYGFIPGGYMIPHRTVHLRCAGQLSTAATPGTFLWALRWGGVGGTVLVKSNGAGATGTAITMAASQTNTFWRGEWYITSRGDIGTAAPLLCTGILESEAIPTKNAVTFPLTAPAAVNSDTSVGKDFALTHTPSLGTASFQGMQYTLESMN